MPMLDRRKFLLAGAITAAPWRRLAQAAPAGKWQPKVAENISSLDDTILRWMTQLGIEWVDLQGSEMVDRDKKGWWSPEDVRAAVDRCAQFGLRIAAITVPIAWQTSPMLAAPQRDRDIENIVRSIAAVGAARIPVFQYRWSPDFYWGEEMGYRTVPGRGGVGFTSFDYDRVKDKPPYPQFGVITYDQLWDRLMHFLRAVIPAAEKAGVKLSLHPKDPPQAMVRGIARLLTSTEQIEKFVDAFPSPVHGFTFCQGTVTEMGVDVIDAIRRIGRRGRIHHVHFRGVKGKVPRYTEVFIDEGDVDMLAAMRAYKEAGYQGTLVSDHTPHLAGDNAAGMMGRSFSHGYIRALIQAVNAGS
jgi:mannonate dehydratase